MDLHGASLKMNIENRNEIRAGRKMGESAIPNLGWRRNDIMGRNAGFNGKLGSRGGRGDWGEIEDIQPCALLELAAMDTAKSRILKNGNVPIVKDRDISQIEGTYDMGDFIGRFRKWAKNRKGGRSKW